MQLIADIESIGLTDIGLTSTGGPSDAGVSASTPDGAITYQISLNIYGVFGPLPERLEPFGTFEQTGTDTIAGIDLRILDRNGSDVAWFQCTHDRAIEVRAIQSFSSSSIPIGTFDDVKELVPVLFSALGCTT